MHTMPRLSKTRSYIGRSSIFYYTMPSISGIRCWTGSCSTSQGLIESWKEKGWDCHTRRKLHCLRWRAPKVPVNMDHDSMDTWDQCQLVPTYNLGSRLFLHPPSVNWDISRSPCGYCLVEDRILCLHQPRSASRIPASVETRGGCSSRNIQWMSVPEQHYTRQLDLFLVGANSGISARLP